jgi:hypothetical protein
VLAPLRSLLSYCAQDTFHPQTVQEEGGVRA